jgi:hypothetical protein
MERMVPRILHRFDQNGIAEELSVGDHLINARHVHLNHPPGTDVEVAGLAVADLTFRQTHAGSGGLDERVRKSRPKPVEVRLTGLGDGIAIDLGGMAPAVQDRQNERPRSRHLWPIMPDGLR